MSIKNDKKTLKIMLQLYCQVEHKSAGLCTDCRDLLFVAEQRLDSCKFGERKPSCNHCPLECYRIGEKEHLQTVALAIRPTLLFRHPILALRHMVRDMLGW